MSAVEKQAIETYAEASAYLKTLERSLTKKSKFNNDLLYGIAAMTFEKLLVSLLASKKIEALHHTPLALYKEASTKIDLPADFKSTAQLLMKFESICSFEVFGYKTPTDDQLRELIMGLLSISSFVNNYQQKSKVGWSESYLPK